MPKFVPRERKHKVRQRLDHGNQSCARDAVDTNVAEIQPSTASEREIRRHALMVELKSQQMVKSSKKQKRLDKYIVCNFFCMKFNPHGLTFCQGQEIAERGDPRSDQEIGTR